MHQPADAFASRGSGDVSRRLDVNRIERLAAPLDEDADEIDRGLCAFKRRGDRVLIAYVRLDDLDLPDPAERP